jgi:hypothetical protein
MELNPAPTQDRGIVGFRVRLQTEEIVKKSDGRKDAKESFTEMYEDRKMENPVWGEMVQGNVKKTKKTMKKRRCGKAQASTNKRNEKNNLASVKIRNSVLTRRLPLGKTLLLDQTIVSQLL